MALNNKTKDRYRRVIRVIMIVLAVVLLVMGLAVPVANNAVAMSIAREMEALPLPSDTTLIDSTSLSGRFDDAAGSVQYFAALLIKSDRPIEDLRLHYAQYTADSILAYRVERQAGREITVLKDTNLAFHEPVGDDGYYIVYTVRTGGSALQWWLDIDVR